MPSDRISPADDERDLFRGRVESLYEILKRLDHALDRDDVGQKQRRILGKAVNSIQLDNPPYSRKRLLIDVLWIKERALEARVKILLFIMKEAFKEGGSSLELDWFTEIESKMSCVNFCLIDAGQIIEPLVRREDLHMPRPVATLVKDFFMDGNEGVLIQEEESMCAVL
ncbi:hypothetical protein Psal006b_00635 [Piscirickettsia salmonis]|uniref:Molybdopterin-guanine dinucleotide biosynthesis protein A n=1 Tax=Piscirickettsia salmonis TaxID=1238 RepID=A0A1L6TE62_PISSA|nr:hypothetical protein [Piscirickettsia salmonis]ALB23733.1 molybdopterin-guanine dinucleotide biosynthesis protein A [Piscirickettsia salmonis]ALT18652.1 hypothetical protein PSLF89_07395 [Piscirickettsia salmonis LF-89 = ATCC VR-1361]ALY03584.1 hypothetical protein AWE47_12605 [Piscirickettsia salmonis]AMA43149.1 hypothetical protein AWJ11_12835 [Piscirickettsia salmonis]AOS35620.1 hypothetical protein AVM72_09960 [Piscirickettsia salmonis]